MAVGTRLKSRESKLIRGSLTQQTSQLGALHKFTGLQGIKQLEYNRRNSRFAKTGVRIETYTKAN